MWPSLCAVGFLVLFGYIATKVSLQRVISIHQVDLLVKIRTEVIRRFLRGSYSTARALVTCAADGTALLVTALG